MIKFAFVVNQYTEHSFPSGGIKLNFLLMKELIRLGYQVDVYASQFYNINNILSNYYKMEEFDNKTKYYDYVFAEKGMKNADITYIHDHSNVHRLSFFMSKKKLFLYKIFKSKQYRKRIDYDETVRNNLKNIKKIIVSSQVLKQDIHRNYDVPFDRLFILPPAVELCKKEYLYNRNEKFVFGLSATGFVRKGGYVTLKAIKMLKKKNKNFVVKIIYPQYKKNLFVKFLILFYGIKNYVDFLDLQSDINQFYTQIDCLLMPSLIEPFGMVAIEAMGNYKPVIMTHTSGACDLIKDAENGYIVKNDKDLTYNLVNKMLEIMNLSENDYKKMCQNAYFSVQNLTCKDFTNKFLNILEYNE